eukprot:10170049-Lingulodinium_polyedra.AAC.1
MPRPGGTFCAPAWPRPARGGVAEQQNAAASKKTQTWRCGNNPHHWPATSSSTTTLPRGWGPQKRRLRPRPTKEAENHAAPRRKPP